MASETNNPKLESKKKLFWTQKMRSLELKETIKIEPPWQSLTKLNRISKENTLQILGPRTRSHQTWQRKIETKIRKSTHAPVEQPAKIKDSQVGTHKELWTYTTPEKLDRPTPEIKA